VLNAAIVGSKSRVAVKGYRACTYVGRPSKWGNPFKEGRDGTREEVIAMFRDYLEADYDLMAQLPELKGHHLICWCSPKPCHADVLLELANG
jgi:hypothetical protein